MAEHDVDVAPVASAGDPVTGLSTPQLRFFRTFGFICVRGLFADEIATISEGFDEVFRAEEPEESHRAVHYGGLRLTIGPGFVERSPKLSWIKSDPRLVGVLTSILGPDYHDDESDGNLFSCDTGWHSDIFGAQFAERLYVKVYFYLDPLGREDGCLRVVPGTNTLTGPFAPTLRKFLWEIDGPATAFDLDDREIPNWPIETMPGDVVFGDYRTMHASFDGRPRRRLFTMNFSAPHESVGRC